MHIWICTWVGAQGGSPRGRKVQDRAEPDHILLPSPSHSRNFSTSTSPDMFFPTTWLYWNEIRANAWLPIIAVTSSEAFLWPWICHEHNGLHMRPMEREEGEGIPKEARASLNVKASLSENSHDKSIKAHAILNLESCLSKKAEWEYLKGQFRWEKEDRRKRHRYPYLNVWRTWQELWLQGRGGIFGMGDTRSEMQEKIKKWNVAEKLKYRADSKSSHPSRTWASG